jgi:O-antigen ligase
MVLYYLKNIAAGTTQETRGSASVRMDMLYAGLHKIDSAMLMGHGVGEATNVVTFVGTAGVRTLDNYYLVMALESGLIGLGLNLLLWLYFFGRSLGFLADRNIDRSRIGVLLSLALLTHIAIMTIHALQSLTWLLMVLFALILILGERRRLAPGPELK